MIKVLVQLSKLCSHFAILFFSNRVVSIFYRSVPIFLTIYILFRITLNLDNCSPWYDEAMQFWISFGCDPDEITMDNSVVEVVKLNQIFNHDPGGFSLLLHFWLKVSQSIEWIRLLPLLFFIGSVMVISLTIQSLFKDKLLSFICSLIPFLFDSLLYFSTEIRAYSMECLCSSFSMLAVCILPKQKAFGKITLFSIMLCLLMTSRYSAIIEVAIAMLVIALYWLRHYRISAKERIFFLIVPFVTIACLIYFFSLSLQNPSIKTPYYIDTSFKIDGLNITFFLIPPCCLFLFSHFKNRILVTLALYVTLLNFAFLILAIFNIHPADIRSKYCIGVFFVNIIFLILLLAKLLSSIKHHTKHNIALGIITLGILLQHRSLSMRKGQDFLDTKELCKLYEKKIYVDETLSPTLKYLTTCGTAKVWKKDINNQISFQKQTPHVLDSNGHMEVTKKVENLDLSFFDIVITTNPISLKNTSDWKNYSNYFYQNIK